MHMEEEIGVFGGSSYKEEEGSERGKREDRSDGSTSSASFYKFVVDEESEGVLVALVVVMLQHTSFGWEERLRSTHDVLQVHLENGGYYRRKRAKSYFCTDNQHLEMQSPRHLYESSNC